MIENNSPSCAIIVFNKIKGLQVSKTVLLLHICACFYAQNIYLEE